jgi:ABC-type enterobactin transport system permease subunit
MPAVAAALLVAAKVWHFWLGVFQAIPFLLIVLIIGGLYVTKVLARKYPKQ